MKEIWKIVTVNEDYEVSNIGNVRSNKGKTPRVLKPFAYGAKKDENTRGKYLSVTLMKNGIGKSYAVHRLVALAFIPNPDNLPQVNHINGVRNDNRVENLEWCDNSYNIWHSYNVLGNKSTQSCSISQYDKNGNFIKEWESIEVASKTLMIHSSSIIEVCKRRKNRKVAGGFIWRYKGDNDLALNYSKKTPVVQISKYGEKIKVFQTVKDAAKEHNISIGGISGCCLKRRGCNYAGGYIWRYEYDYDDDEFGYYLDKTFIQMTMNNIFVAEYKGTHELVDNANIELLKVIKCCDDNNKSTNGYKWYIKEECNRVREQRREIPVVQFSKDWEYLNEYASAKKASLATNTCATHISDSCQTRGVRTCGGFRWKYKKDFLIESNN